MSRDVLQPFRLRPFFSPRPWGRHSLEPWYSAAQTGATEPIGEAWLTGPECVAETGPFAGQTLAAVAQSSPRQLLGENFSVAKPQPTEFPLLIKLLFPADKLSVQVHPDDAHAQAMGQPRGKTECWYVLSADPGAQIALGLQPHATHDSVRSAIAAGTLEGLMQWLPVTPGDMVFVDAGTVHAIGPGMVLLETQQTSDTTFRMYDYGRPRELHVDQALRVMKTSTAAGKVEPRKMRARNGSEFTRLIQQQYFTVDRYDLAANSEVTIDSDKPGCLVTLTGSAAVIVGPEGQVDALPGQAIIVPANIRSVTVETGEGISFVHCWAP